MAKIHAGLSQAHVATEAKMMTQRDELFSDRMLSIVAISGAIGGAVGGIMLGVEFETAFPIACGTLGTMLGGGLSASVWCLLDPFWSAPFTGHEDAPK